MFPTARDVLRRGIALALCASLLPTAAAGGSDPAVTLAKQAEKLSIAQSLSSPDTASTTPKKKNKLLWPGIVLIAAGAALAVGGFTSEKYSPVCGVRPGPGGVTVGCVPGSEKHTELGLAGVGVALVGVGLIAYGNKRRKSAPSIALGPRGVTVGYSIKF